MTKYEKHKSMYKQWKEGDITRKEYRDQWVQRNGYKNLSDYVNQKANQRAISKGYKNFNDYQNQRNHILGLCKSMYEDKNSALYLGVVVAERVLSKVFEEVKRMHHGNPGFDFICKNGYKIDVKSSCLHKTGNHTFWKFNINKNKIADYFLLLAFDNREDLNPKRIWLIKGTEIINACLLNNKESLDITNNKKGRRKYKKYRQTDKLRKTVACCDIMKEEDDALC